jgi:hypothetical protein
MNGSRDEFKLARNYYDRFDTIAEIYLMEDIQESYYSSGIWYHKRDNRNFHCSQMNIVPITFKVMLRKLVDDGFIEKIGRGKYKPTDSYVI